MEDNSDINSTAILNSIDINKLNQNDKKKRGRPKKIHQINNNIPKIKISSAVEDNEEEEEIILHLPITLSKLEIEQINSNNFKLDETSEIEETIDEKNDVKKDEKKYEKKVEKYNKEDFKNITGDETRETDKDIVLSNNANTIIKKYYNKIKKLEEENEELKKYLADITPMYFTEVKIYPVNLKLFDMDNNKLIPVQTNICCWWCTYNFDNLPTFLPEKYSEGKFHVSGCFCSFNCAGAYNLSLNDDKKNTRYSLLKLLYYNIYKDKLNYSMSDIEINIAGPKEILEKYGGSMKIEDYRKNSKILGREYHKLIPPFIPINHGFEEITSSKTEKNNNISNIIINNIKNEAKKNTKTIDNYIVDI